MKQLNILMSNSTAPTQSVEDKDKKAALAKMLEQPEPATAEDYLKFDQDLWMFFKAFPWYASCFAQMRRIITRAIPTACVGIQRGEICFFANPDFVFGLKTYERFAIYCHEIEHIVRNHLGIIENWPNKNSSFNIVTDALINESLLRLPEFNRQMFDEINNFMRSQKGRKVLGIPNTVPDTEIGLIDYKKFQWIASQNPHKPKAPWQGNVSTEQFVDDWMSEQLIHYIAEDDAREACQNMYGSFGEFLDDQSIPDDLKEAMLQNMLEEAEKNRGLAPAHLQRYINLLKDKTRRDWRTLMRGLGISNIFNIRNTWAKVNKKTPWLKPGRQMKPLPKIIVMVDTSGSVGQKEMEGFYREIRSLAQRSVLDIAFVDASFDKNNKLQFIKNVRKDQIFNHKPYGGGGTVFQEFYDFMLSEEGRRYQSLLILTDGYADYIPEKLARNQVLLMTPVHHEEFAKAAAKLGFKIAIIEDKKKV